MAIDLLAIKPHKVSTDLTGYLTYIYGPAGIGKTTFGSQMPKPLLLAAERGYNAIPGIAVQDITSWAEFRMVCKELKKDEVKAAYSSIIIDTIDIFSDLCQKYICNNLNIQDLGEGGWTKNGWAKYKKEFDETFRTLAQLGYAIVFISHEKEKTIKPQYGEEYQKITPSLQSSAEAIIENACDIIGYAHSIVDQDGIAHRVLTLRSDDNSILCKSRFPNIASEIEFSYEALSTALADAINNNAGEFITSAKIKPIEPTGPSFVELKNEFNEIVETLKSKLGDKFGTEAAPEIVTITDKYLGKGKKVGDLTSNQIECLELVVADMHDLVEKF